MTATEKHVNMQCAVCGEPIALYHTIVTSRTKTGSLLAAHKECVDKITPAYRDTN